MSYHTPKGTFDILPSLKNKEPWKEISLWQFVESIMHKTAVEYGFDEVRTPIFEDTHLFTRSVGASSDIASKEMYTFLDKKERSLSLRPEGTAPVMRLALENRIDHTPFHKLFYIGPFFRYDRPQAGRFRQFHQFGVEAIGVKDPSQDAEVIDMLLTIIKKLKIEGTTLLLNSIGDKEERCSFLDALKLFLKPHLSALSKESQKRFHTNPLRILDSKDEKDRQLIEKGPHIQDFLGSETKEHFDTLKKHLNALNIPFRVDPYLVRGLDYYNRTVFEIVSNSIGAQSSLGGGGRYDPLLESLGGPSIPAIGFALGMERLIQVLPKNLEIWKKPFLTLIPIGDKEREEALILASKMREEGLPVTVYLKGGKVAKGFSFADQIGSPYAAALGEFELSSQMLKIKCMKTGDEVKVPFEGAASHLLLRP